MKYICFEEQGRYKIGLLTKNENYVLELEKVLKRDIPSMIDFIKTVTEEEISTLEKEMLREKSEMKYSEVRLVSPIPRPVHDIICVGVNYYSHKEETRENLNKEISTIDETVYFSKRASRIMGHGEVIESYPNLVDELDYEVELAVIIGKEGKSIPLENVEEHIFGYSIFNDISARNLQKKHFQWFRGKSLDGFSVMGPCILHKSALKLPIEVDISCFINEEERQKSNTKFLIRGVREIIAEISQALTLEPGDIIITGTPAGVGMAFHPPKFLKSGDRVRCSIPEIGVLENLLK